MQYECCTNFFPPTLGDEEQQKSKMDHLKAIDDLRKVLKENRQVHEVHEEIAQKYQVDLEVVIHTECNEHLRKQKHNVKIKFSSYITTSIALETASQGVHRTCID